MTVQVVGYRVHPSVCPCGGKGVIAVSFVGYDHLGGCLRAAVSRMALVIPCPQCRDAGELLGYLQRCETTAPAGPDGAA